MWTFSAVEVQTPSFRLCSTVLLYRHWVRAKPQEPPMPHAASFPAMHFRVEPDSQINPDSCFPHHGRRLSVLPDTHHISGLRYIPHCNFDSCASKNIHLLNFCINRKPPLWAGISTPRGSYPCTALILYSHHTVLISLPYSSAPHVALSGVHISLTMT